jgi:hypothetical protein
MNISMLILFLLVFFFTLPLAYPCWIKLNDYIA